MYVFHVGKKAKTTTVLLCMYYSECVFFSFGTGFGNGKRKHRISRLKIDFVLPSQRNVRSSVKGWKKPTRNYFCVHVVPDETEFLFCFDYLISKRRPADCGHQTGDYRCNIKTFVPFVRRVLRLAFKREKRRQIIMLVRLCRIISLCIH